MLYNWIIIRLELNKGMIIVEEKVMSIEEKAAEKAEKLGWKLLKTAKLPHPDDHYLIYTIVERKINYPDGNTSKDYATHLFNGSFNEFAYGHYDIRNYAAAELDLQKRLER